MNNEDFNYVFVAEQAIFSAMFGNPVEKKQRFWVRQN
jgi:hypothetical protein